MNIVFDLGGVVFKWKPDDPHQQHIFQHSDWAELDKGVFEHVTVIETDQRMKSQYFII